MLPPSLLLQINAASLIGLPRVRGVFGHSEKVELPSAWQVTPKGGTTRGTLVEYIEKCIDPCYPNVEPDWQYDSDGSEDSVGDKPIVAGPLCLKTDMGPDRVDTDEASLSKRQKLHEQGYLAYPGYPNGSAANQEMDQLYGEYKANMSEVADDIVKQKAKTADAQRSKKQKPSPVNLTNLDLPRIVNGRKGDALKKRPFNHAFGPEYLASALDAVGAVSADGWVTRASLSHPKVRPAPPTASRAAAAPVAAPVAAASPAAAATSTAPARAAAVAPAAAAATSSAPAPSPVRRSRRRLAPAADAAAHGTASGEMAAEENDPGIGVGVGAEEDWAKIIEDGQAVMWNYLGTWAVERGIRRATFNKTTVAHDFGMSGKLLAYSNGKFTVEGIDSPMTCGHFYPLAEGSSGDSAGGSSSSGHPSGSAWINCWYLPPPPPPPLVQPLSPPLVL